MKTRILSLIAALLVTGPLGIAQEFTPLYRALYRENVVTSPLPC